MTEKNVKNYSTVVTITAICNVNKTHEKILQQRTLRHGNLMPNLIYFQNGFNTERYVIYNNNNKKAF